MKLKYYLRGIGIGIIVTTIIMAIVLARKPETLTDAVERYTIFGGSFKHPWCSAGRFRVVQTNNPYTEPLE